MLIRVVSVLIAVLMLGQSVYASGCFDKHVADAIESNKTRRELYAQHSGGATRPISDRLIQMEVLSRYAAKVIYGFDSHAKPFQKKGVNIVCDEFVDMGNAPDFQVRAPEPWPTLQNFKKPDAKKLSSRLKNALKNKSYEGLFQEALVVIEELNVQPQFNCMTRHLVESIAKIAQLAPGHMIKAKELNLRSPEFLSKDLIESHFIGIKDLVNLDEKAAPLQAQGIPILCRDVPPIPLH